MAAHAGPELPRERYFSLCNPDSDWDGGTLAEELNAYCNVRDDIDVQFGEALEPSDSHFPDAGKRGSRWVVNVRTAMTDKGGHQL